MAFARAGAVLLSAALALALILASAQAQTGPRKPLGTTLAPPLAPSLAPPLAAPLAAPLPEVRPDPVETPIGTEANAFTSVLENLPRIERPAKIAFKIAAWNLKSRAPGDAAETVAEPTAPPTTWRHTFGSERTTAEWRRHGTVTFRADIVALQGIDRNIYRTFNASEYHVVASRQLLSRAIRQAAAPVIRADTYRRDAPPTTAIAFRRRLGVRIAGYRHFLPAAGGANPEPPAITAIRLRIWGQLLWIASVDVPPGCTSEMTSSICAPHAAVLAEFREWVQRVGREQAPLLLIGRWHEAFIATIANAGLDIRATLAAATSCTLEPTAMVIAAPKTTPPDFSKLENQAPADANACVSTADLTINLR